MFSNIMIGIFVILGLVVITMIPRTISIVKEMNKKEKRIEISDLVYSMKSWYINELSSLYGYGEITDVISGDVENLEVGSDLDVLKTLDFIYKTFHENTETYSLVLDKYEETFNITLKNIKHAIKMKVFDEPSFHENINKVLQEPLNDIHKIKKNSLDKLNQELKNEVSVLERNYGN